MGSFDFIKTKAEKVRESKLKWKKIKRGSRAKKFKIRLNASKKLNAARTELDENGILEDQFNFLKNYNPRWIKVRAFVLKRDRFACYCCGKVNRANHCHHILPRRYPGSSNAANNLITVCPKDHRWVDLEIWRRISATGLESHMTKKEILAVCVRVLVDRKKMVGR